MRKHLWMAAVLVIILPLILAACGGSGGTNSGTKNPAATAVENYLKAVVAKDAAKVSTLACKAFEPQALLEMLPGGLQGRRPDLVGVSVESWALPWAVATTLR